MNMQGWKKKTIKLGSGCWQIEYIHKTQGRAIGVAREKSIAEQSATQNRDTLAARH